MKYHKTSIILQRNVSEAEVRFDSHHLQASITAADSTAQATSIEYLAID